MFPIAAILILIFFNVTIEANDKNLTEVSYRNEKFFPFYTVVRFENTQCIGVCKLMGTCYTIHECKKYGGMASGFCAQKLGVCCIAQRTCGGTSHLNNTYFQNPGFPNAYQGGQTCTITIRRCNPNICQLRLDFLDFKLAQPNGDGMCINDRFTVSGDAGNVSTICGDNVNSHMYVNFNGDSPISLTIRTSSLLNIDRRWNIKISQIPCDSRYRAPTGCLQYYTDLMGTVKSFNYDTAVNSQMNQQGVTGTREIANQNYGVCVEMAPGYCSIEWSQDPNDAFSFTVSGDTTMPVPMTDGLSGDQCTTDFVIVPNAMDGVNPPADRFCGGGFTTKTSNLKPFVLYVVTDNDEALDVANHGFKLNYRQLPC